MTIGKETTTLDFMGDDLIFPRKKITPNNKRTYRSLRHAGYHNNSAVKDLVDNCVDALIRKYGRENISQGFIEVLVEAEPTARAAFDELDLLGTATEEQKDILTESNIRSIKFIDSGTGIENSERLNVPSLDCCHSL